MVFVKRFAAVVSVAVLAAWPAPSFRRKPPT